MNRLIILGSYSYIDYQISQREGLRIQEEELLLLEKLGEAQLELKLIIGGNTHVLK